MTFDEKESELLKVAQEIVAFKDLPIAKNCTKAVPGEGNPEARVMFIGEAPGFNEDRLGRPFVGQAGQLLEKHLQDILRLNRSDVYITNIVKYRPPDNRDPLPDEIAACAGWLDRQIEIINPPFIVTLGRFSMGKFIPGVSISRVHGQPRFINFANSRITVYPMFHPAAALRSEEIHSQFIEDFKKFALLVNPPKPQVENKTKPTTSSSDQLSLNI